MRLYKYYTLFALTILVPFSATAGCNEKYVCSKTLTMFGQGNNVEPKHFDYVNPKAPKGGAIKYGVIGTYDSLNSFILKGVSAAGVGLIYDTLMASDSNDIFTKYGLLAGEVKVAKDKLSMIFVLRKEAKWHDGKPVTADDVVFTFNTLIEKGNPFYKAYYADVDKVEKINDREVKFTFKRSDNRELPFILGELAVLPKHYYDTHKFDETTLEPPLGSGAYVIEKIDAGRSISYKRFENYWAKDLFVNVGENNFDTITYDYYRDETVSVEALKAGQYDIRQENIARIWATSYDIPAVKEGKLIKSEIPHDMPTGMQAFVLNLRKDKFSDVRVRQALELAFDYEWTNKTLFYGSYTRTRSYFSNSIYEATGLPTGKELEILNKYKAKLPKEVFTTEYNPSKTDGSGNNRDNLKKAIKLLADAGWKIKEGKLQNDKGEGFQIEFLLDSATFERIIEPYRQNLKKLGIETSIRTVDPSQYQKRLDDFDYDIISRVFGSGSVPGNELIDLYHSERAKIPGSANISGIQNEVVDKLVDEVIRANDKETLIATVKALDRVLQNNHYLIPHWNIKMFRLVHWNKFGKPKISPKYGLGVGTWWSLDAEKGQADKPKTDDNADKAGAKKKK